MRNWIRWGLGILVFVIVLFISIQLILTPWLEQKVQNTLQEQQSTHFKAEVKNLKINFFSASLTSDSVFLYWVRPVSAVDSSTGREFHLHLKSLKITGISLWQWLVHDKIDIDKLVLSDSEFQVVKKPLQQAIEYKTESSFNQIAGITIKALEMDTSVFRFIDSIKNTKFVSGFKNMDGGIQMLSNGHSGFKIQQKRSHFQIKDYKASFPGGYYDMHIKKCSLSGKDSIFRIDSLKLIPLLDKYSFSQKYGYRTDRVVLHLKKLMSEGLDVQALQNGEYHAKMIILSGFYTDIFRDARLPFKPGKFTVLLQKKLNRLPFTFTVDSTLLEHSKIRYEEKRIDDQTTGNLILEDVKIAGGRITNDSSLIEHTIYAPKGTAKFMGVGQLEADFHFPLSKMNGYHRVSGHLGPMPIMKVNPILYPLTNFRIQSGQNDNVYFNMELDEIDASGEMRFYYHDLKIKMGTEKEAWLNNIGSFLANQIVRSNNPINGKFREGTISYQRDNKRSIFNYWWKSLRSGLLTTVGLSPNVVE